MEISLSRSFRLAQLSRRRRRWSFMVLLLGALQNSRQTPSGQRVSTGRAPASSVASVASAEPSRRPAQASAPQAPQRRRRTMLAWPMTKFG